MMSIRSRIETIVVEELQLKITPKDDDTLVSLGADSLDVFSLLVGFEEEFETELNKKPFPDELLSTNDNFGQVVKKVEDFLRT